MHLSSAYGNGVLVLYFCAVMYGFSLCVCVLCLFFLVFLLLYDVVHSCTNVPRTNESLSVYISNRFVHFKLNMQSQPCVCGYTKKKLSKRKITYLRIKEKEFHINFYNGNLIDLIDKRKLRTGRVRHLNVPFFLYFGRAV